MSLNAFFANLAKDKGTTNFVLYDDHAASSSDLRKGDFTKMQRRNSCSRSRRSSAAKFSASECSQPLAIPTRKRSNDKLNRGHHHQVVEKVNNSTSESKISSRMLLALHDEVKSPSTSKAHKSRRKASSEDRLS
jgi:hypothetical protein